MVTECRQIVALSSKQIMSAKNATLPCATLQPFNGLGITLNSMTNTFKNSLKDDKKVEVRWLESESDLYLKQWQRRYRQLEGIDANINPRTWSKSYLLEHYEDWYLTARSILDIDVEYMNTKDFNKFNLENHNHSFDFFFNREKSNFLFNIEDSLEDDGFEFEDNIMQFDTLALDPTIEYNQEIISALKSNNLIVKNGKLEYFNKKGKSTDKEKTVSEKQYKKTQKTQPIIERANLVPEESSSVPSSDTSPSKSSTKSPRKANANKQQRPRPPSARRQMYICEYPGCSYQSDRNFNFLRHKRTHGKQKNDENKKLHNGMPTPSDLIYEATHTKAPNLNDSARNEFMGLDMGSINNDITHLSSQSPLLSSELNLNMIQRNSINLSENDQTFSLANDDFLERQNIIMKDINNLEHVLGDNHFASLALEQSFLS